ncbi:hypothetical protein C6P42_002447 [Pichia californica]|nr:hypothetical protein C6P42_002447 [[Candida] californica]
MLEVSIYSAESRTNSNDSAQINHHNEQQHKLNNDINNTTTNITNNSIIDTSNGIKSNNNNNNNNNNNSIKSQSTNTFANEQRHRDYNNHNDVHREHHEHHANELKPFAQNIVRQESIDENKRQQESRKSIERYKMGSVLGEGAFSVVYSAIDLLTKEKVAIKIIKKYQLDEKQRNNVLKEVNIMKLLNHPNIVRLIDFIENKDYYYIVQEIVSGGEVFNQIVKFTYFSEDLSRHVIVQVAEALLYMHEQVGIVHRDLKPENIFFKPIKIIKEDQKTKILKLRKSDNPNTKLDEGKFIMNYGGGGIGLIKIGDFGLSKQISLNNSDSALKTPCGTVGYTAPEIVRDMKYSKEVDMWALGCVLYILLCGFPPFFNDSIEELTKTVAKGEFKFLSPWWNEISSGAKICVSKLLTVNPLHRYTVEQFLKDPWILEFLNRSENLQIHEKLKKKVQQRQSSINLSNNDNTSDSSRSTSIPITLDDETLISSDSSNIINKSKNEILSTNLNNDLSGMPGFQLGVGINGNLSNEETKIPLNTYTSVYSQSVMNVHKTKKEEFKSSKLNSKSKTNLTTETSKMDIDLVNDEDNDDDDDDENMSDELSSSDEDENSDESIGGFDDRHRTAVIDALPMLEHILDPAPASESLREDHPNEKVQIESKGEIKKSNKKNGKKLYTPEMKVMKDMYDISIAARRMHEESQFTPGYNNFNDFNDLNIVEENEDDNGVILNNNNNNNNKNRIINNNNNNNNNTVNMFTLNMNDASILARRQKKRQVVVG